MLKKLSSDTTFLLGVFLLLCVSYFPLWNGDFLGDDVARIEMLTPDTAFDYLITELGDRPLLSLSVWFDRFVLGMSAGMMRIHGIFLIAGLALVLRKIALQASAMMQSEADPRWIDFVILLTVLHPLNSQTVGHIIQRGVILSALGALLSTFWILKARFDFRSPYMKYALLAWIVAILCKPNTAFFPALWFVLLFGLGYAKEWKNLLPFVLVIFIPVLSYVFSGFNAQTTPASSIDYFILQGEAWLLYFRLILVPIGLKFNHDLMAVQNASLSPGLLYWLVIGLAAFGIHRAFKSKISKLFWIGTLLAFLPESSFFPIIHGSFEHRTFAPICLLGLAIAACGVRANAKVTVSLTFLACVFIGLNIRRSYETRNVKKWMLAEISYTCNYDFMVLSHLKRLVDMGSASEAEHILRNVRKCDPPVSSDGILFTYLEIVKSRKTNPEVLKKVSPFFHSDSGMNKFYRLVANEAIIEAVDATAQCKSSNLTCDELYCNKEEFLANQLRAITVDPAHYQNNILAYILNASECLKKLATSNDAESAFTKLKIRTILSVYFGSNDAALETELLKAGPEERYVYLLSLLRGHLKKI